MGAVMCFHDLVVQLRYYLVNFIDKLPVFVFLALNFVSDAYVKDVHVHFYLVLVYLVCLVYILEGLNLLDVALHVHGWF